MGVSIAWRINQRVSVLHAAWTIARRGANESPVADKGDFFTQANALADELAIWGVAPDLFWPTSIGYAMQVEAAPGWLCRVFEMFGREVAAEKKGQLLGDERRLEAAFVAQFPKWRRELELRIGPLRLLWESRAPGLLSAAAELSGTPLGDAIEMREIEVIVVAPGPGRFGIVLPKQHIICLEALLANISQKAPETLRLAWLVVRLLLECQTAANPNAKRASALAAIPLVLEAGHRVALCRCDMATIAESLEIWISDDHDSPATAQQIHAWWEQYQHGARRPWFDAVRQLELAMLA